MISVVIPIYQVEKYILNCLKSLRDQTFRNFEIIIVNDGTKDNSIKIAISYLKDISQKYTILNQSNQGVSAARNKGIKLASGEWVICIDSDDILHKDFLKLLYDSAIKNHTVVSIGSYQMVTMNNPFKSPELNSKVSIYNQEYILERFLIRDIKIISPAILIKKDFIIQENLFYDENMLFSEDMHWIWRILLKITRVSYVHMDIYNYNNRPNSTMTSSGIEKIMTGYKGFVVLNDHLRDNDQLHNKILDRWVLGSLRASCKMVSYETFKMLSNTMSYKTHFKRLKHFSEIKVKILTQIILRSKLIFYIIGKYL